MATFDYYPSKQARKAENASYPPILSPSDLERLGSIRVSIFRAKRKKLAVPVVYNQERPETLQELPEKHLEGKALEIIVKTGTSVAARARAPTSKRYSYRPKDGTQRNGECSLTTSGTLQTLGCIPRSPSPELDAIAILQRADNLPLRIKQQAREMDLLVLALAASPW
ncbi:uncharacterized protein A1O9_03144 [Exophiala aquamarina CBS 119918]|uniref:DUF7918 domain-containing protein n=1 Tax=Exophiala aquamarina CBS 119918 TaxID=1182545 RepID=A0A072PNV7_9EURO|nr:uncharacterized protein A1O9_03144 [Exophiala aquamarina CBS 119918]KEF61576.1 hypothetical protein A1O9_03144 [Exophiala aquamarina CBS 119918]